MDKLRNPPLVGAALNITFPHNLRISNLRADYYEDIKDVFPHIVLPEIKSLTYDFSDCNFQNKEGNGQIRLGTSYFSFETLKYEKSDKFWELFERLFSQFVKRITIPQINGFGIDFLNKIVIKSEIGASFADYFTLALISKGTLPRDFVTFDGQVVLKAGVDLLKVDVRPAQNPQTRQYDFNILDFRINYIAGRTIPVDAGLKSIKNVFDEGHKHIEDVFRSSLTDKYWETIR